MRAEHIAIIEEQYIQEESMPDTMRMQKRPSQESRTCCIDLVQNREAEHVALAKYSTLGEEIGAEHIINITGYAEIAEHVTLRK